MPQWSELFEDQAEFDPAEDFGQWTRGFTDRGAVYLMADGEDRAVQLLCVGNLRYSLRRRLGEEAPSRRADYRAVVRRIYWRRVDSPFEADWVYLEAARRVFPQSYQGMLGFRPAWWLHVDTQADVPRYAKITDPSGKGGAVLGPMEQKHAAGRLIEMVEDLFDLCRYEHILAEAPHGKACAYKEMGKCPAPCDGSITMGSYRHMLQRSIDALGDPGAFVEEQRLRMEQAAQGRQFEAAGKIKAYIEELERLGKGAYEHVRPLGRFIYVAIEPGRRAGTARVFLIRGGRIEEICGLIGVPTATAAAMMQVLGREDAAAPDAQSVERMAMVTHHLYAGRRSRGVILHIEQVNERSLKAAWRHILRQPEAEGVEKEDLRQELREM